MSDSASDRSRGFLIGYWFAGDRHSVRISLAGELGPGGAELVGACRTRIRRMAVTSVCFDLSALRGVDDAGARSLADLCRALRLDGMKVDVCGMQTAVRSVVADLG